MSIFTATQYEYMMQDTNNLRIQSNLPITTVSAKQWDKGISQKDYCSTITET